MENHDALKHLPAYKPIICLPFGSDDSFNDDTRMLVRRHGDAVLMKAVGGTGHRFNDNLVEIERIGLSNNKLPIKHHIRQRTGENVIFPVLWQKVQDRLLASLNRH